MSIIGQGSKPYTVVAVLREYPEDSANADEYTDIRVVFAESTASASAKYGEFLNRVSRATGAVFFIVHIDVNEPIL